jgi:hypothetical protein
MRIRKAFIETGAPAVDLISVRQILQFIHIAAKEYRVWQKSSAVAQFYPSLAANGNNRTFQMLICAHASSDAIHDDPYFLHGLTPPAK